jgi:hypothetical protein
MKIEPGLEGLSRTRSDQETRRKMKQLVLHKFGLPAETSILLTELQCLEEGCPPIETVIAILDKPGEPRQYKIHKPMAVITDQDLDEIINGLHDHHQHQRDNENE